jgi:hypothetical protein
MMFASIDPETTTLAHRTENERRGEKKLIGGR